MLFQYELVSMQKVLLDKKKDITSNRNAWAEPPGMIKIIRMVNLTSGSQPLEGVFRD